MTRPRRTKPVLGWREWVALPDLGVAAIKTKVDTGARTSVLHAFRLHEFTDSDHPWVRFEIHPEQRSARSSLTVECPVAGYRKVRSSTGHVQTRPVIRTSIELAGQRWPIDVTLTSRDEMGFRMLIGRAAIKGRFLVDPSRSYLHASQP